MNKIRYHIYIHIHMCVCVYIARELDLERILNKSEKRKPKAVLNWKHRLEDFSKESQQ